jgi:hypothetical protein
MSRIVIVILIYHRHKPIDLIHSTVYQKIIERAEWSRTNDPELHSGGTLLEPSSMY